jgi:hypothetical protein
MKRSVVLLIGLAALLATAATAGDDKPWFDMEGCSFCKHITAEEGLKEHMCFEYHELINGILSITTVDPDFQEAYERAQKSMEAVGAEMMKNPQAQPPYMCGHCEAYGGFIQAGVMPQHVQTAVGDILVWTSDDSTMVAKLHAFANRSMEEMAKMKSAKPEEK